MKNILCILALIATPVLSWAQVSISEKQALVDLYTATKGEQWSQSWDLEAPVTSWQGVTIEDDHVVGISLLFNNLEGTLPSSLKNLPQLKVLELSFNKISGTIPQELGELQNLEVLALNANNLEGRLPSSLGAITGLKQLHVSSNKLSGTIPTAYEVFQELEVFNVFDNKLEGAIPVGIGRIDSLRELMVSGNNFTNPQDFSYVLLTNSGVLDLNQENTLTPATKTVIAIETSDDEN